MSHRYSRVEKGKGKEEEFPLRKPLVKVPDTDVSELIERNKLTLIGRVTNPTIQKPRALVDFFLQQWHVVGRISGRDLGPTLFQFSFESEKDLQTILAKAPFHFKNWMIIVQRWEPIVSDTFPSQIPFWVNAHGIPLHYWKDETIEAIGSALGPIDAREVDKARLRVRVNGLKPLIMKLDLQLPSREVVEVELEYERIGKHCFCCKSLDHEDSEKRRCPHSRSLYTDRGNLGISQHNTLERIEATRRRQDERKLSRQQNAPNYREARWTNVRNANSRSETTHRGQSLRNDSTKSSGFEENRRRFDDRNFSYHNSPPRRSLSKHAYQEQVSSSRKVNSSQAKEQEDFIVPQGSKMNLAVEGTPRSHTLPADGIAKEQKRASLASRLSDPRSGNASSEDRVSAKERLSVNTVRTSRSSLAGSETLGSQDSDSFAATESPLKMANTIITRPSSSHIFETGRLGPCERSPIRSLSEDRVHVSLRLGPLRSEVDVEDDNAFDLQLQQALSSKAAGKRVAEKPPSRRRTNDSPAHGVGVKRRRVTKAKPSPRRKLMMDAITAGGRTHARKNQKEAPSTKTIPPMVRKGKDFRPPQDSLH